MLNLMLGKRKEKLTDGLLIQNKKNDNIIKNKGKDILLWNHLTNFTKFMVKASLNYYNLENLIDINNFPTNASYKLMMAPIVLHNAIKPTTSYSNKIITLIGDS